MKNNTVTAYNGVEVYTDKIHELADEYITCELSEERKQEIYNNSSMFMAMILYIADNMDKPDNNDIQLLDNIFNIYIRLCVKYNMLPSDNLNGISVLQDYLRQYSANEKMLVIAKRGNEVLFIDRVDVVVGNYNIYFRVDIMWEDIEPDFRNIGLRGYYSTSYYQMNFSNKVLTIYDNNIEITITQ